MWTLLIATALAILAATTTPSPSLRRSLRYKVQLLVGWLMEHLKLCHLLYIRSRRPKRIILMRHAESEGNVDKRIYTSTPDHALRITERGRQQAAEAGDKLKELIGEESVYFMVSPYTRTRMTYEIVLKKLNPKEFAAKEDPRLRELDFGNFQDFVTMQETMEIRKAYGRFWYRFMNGESGADVYDRATAFWESVHRSMDSTGSEPRYRNYVIITHGLMMRLILMRYFQWKVEFFERVWNPGNCNMWVMERDERGGYQLATDMRDLTEDRACPDALKSSGSDIARDENQVAASKVSGPNPPHEGTGARPGVDRVSSARAREGRSGRGVPDPSEDVPGALTAVRDASGSAPETSGLEHQASIEHHSPGKAHEARATTREYRGGETLEKDGNEPTASRSLPLRA